MGGLTEVPEPRRRTRALRVDLHDILDHPDGPSQSQVDRWVRIGLLKPTIIDRGGKNRWEWSKAEQRVAIGMACGVRAGLTPEAAEKVARHPTWGPVALGHGVVVSLFSREEVKEYELDKVGGA